MAHDPATARAYYYKADAEQQSHDIHQRMRSVYSLAPAAVSPEPCIEGAASIPSLPLPGVKQSMIIDRNSAPLELPTAVATTSDSSTDAMSDPESPSPSSTHQQPASAHAAADAAVLLDAVLA